MEFVRIKAIGADDQEHSLIQVRLDSKEIEDAEKVAARKLQFINVHDPGGKVRDPEVIRNRIIAGKLADYAVAGYLRGYISSHQLPHLLEEYDAIRTDGFRDPDLFDLRIGDGSSAWEVEVRSSFAYIVPSADRIVQRLSIYGWYVSGNKVNEPHRPFYWQVIYHMRPRDVEPEPQWPNVPIFEEELAARTITLYIVGGATCSMLEGHAVACNRSDQDGALYRAVHPIYRGLTPPQAARRTLKLPG